MTVDAPIEEEDLEDRADVCIICLEEDRDIVVFPLVETFRRLEATVCELRLRAGKSLLELVDLALQVGRYCVLVVSPRFLMRSTPPDELAATAALRREDERPVLALWYRVTEEQIRARSPELADLPSAKWSDGVPAAAATLWGMIFPRVPRERSGPITPLPEAATVADVLRPLRDVAACRLAYDEPQDEHDHALIKGLRALLDMWMITVDSSDTTAEGVMIEAFRMAFDDLNGSACRMFAGRVDDSAPDADPREVRPLGVVVIGRPDAKAAELVGDWVVVRR